MKKITLKESDLKEKFCEIYKEEQIKILEEKWSKTSESDKLFVIEFIKQLYPEKSKMISESKWYNTVGDILGFFDPTGVVDILNGISYWRQGDKLFAILSWISAVPIIGDVIGKSVMGLFKMGRSGAKLFKKAALAGDFVKMGEIAAKGGPLKGLLSKVTQWAPKILEPLKKLIGKVPFVGTGFVKMVDDYIKLFKDASRSMDQGAQVATYLTKKMATKTLTDIEKKTLKKAIEQATTFRGFRDFTGKGGFAAGMGRLWGNRGTRGLMRRTRWYLGLLDYIGLGNFVGPEELEQKVPDIESKINEYNKTAEAENNIKQDLGSEYVTQQEPSVPPPTEPSKGKEVAKDLFSMVFPELGLIMK
jgi:hypothetical protein